MGTEKNQTAEIMENLSSPTVEVSSHKSEFRVTLMNTRKSAIAGGLFLILPFLFLSGVILKHYLNIDFGIFTSVYEWIGRQDRMYGDSSLINWVIRILLLFGPLIAITINFLAILHVRYESHSKEIIMSIKLKWRNWLIIIVCSAVFLVFFSYLILENLK